METLLSSLDHHHLDLRQWFHTGQSSWFLTSLFEANYSLNPRMGFKGRRGKRFEAAEEFAERIKQVQKKVKAVLGKAQEKMRKYIDKKRREGVEFEVGDLVLLNTKELKWHMKGRRLEKLTEQFVGPYKVKSIISVNVVELQLPSTVHIHLVVNVSKLQLYKLQVKGQKVTKPTPVIIEGEEEYKVEKILNKRRIWGRDKFLVF